MDFPDVVSKPCDAPPGLAEALGGELSTCGFNGKDYLVEVAGEKVLRGLKPNFTALSTLPVQGIIATSRIEATVPA